MALAQVKHKLSRIKKALIGTDETINFLDVYSKEPSRLDNDIAGLIELISTRFGYRRSTFKVTIDPPDAWIELKDGIKIKVNSKFNSVSTILLRQDLYEDIELELFKANISKNDIVIDVGGNVGLYSIAAALKDESVQVYAFEPVPDTLNEFRCNVAKNEVGQQVKLIPKALSNESGYSYITTEYHSSNYVTDVKSTEKKAKISLTTLDKFAEREQLKSIDMIKMDIEGHEINALIGAKKSISKFTPKILIEIYEEETKFNDRKSSSAKDTFKFLDQFGYKYIIVGEDGRLVTKNNKKRSFKKSYHNYLFYIGDDKLKLP